MDIDAATLEKGLDIDDDSKKSRGCHEANDDYGTDF